MTVVASDLEGTLTVGETWKGVGRYLLRHGQALAYRRFLLTHLPGVAPVKARLRDERAFRDRWIADLSRLFARLAPGELGRLAEWVVEHELWPKRRAGVLAELERHRRAGSRVVLASGTYQPVLEAFARRIGAEAVGTPLAPGGGGVAGAVNTDRAKAARLRAFLGGATPAVAYGDTLADLPMLELSQTPVAVHPDIRLRRVALARGWRVLLTDGATPAG